MRIAKPWKKWKKTESCRKGFMNNFKTWQVNMKLFSMFSVVCFLYKIR